MKLWRRLRANSKLLTLLAVGSALLAAGCAARRMSQDYIFDVIGVVQTEDGAPVRDAEVILEINGTVYEGVTPVKTVKRLTDSTGGFIFMYISGETRLKYTLAHRTQSGLRTADHFR